MDPLPDLLASIEGDPHDVHVQLVLADHLLAYGDERGELIVLDCRERTTPGGLDDREALERLLLLAAEYTFPQAREVDESPLPFEGGGAYPVQYELAHRDHHYYVRYRHGELSVTIDDGEIDSGVDYPDGYPAHVHDLLVGEGEWTDEETQQILGTLSAAIRHGTPLDELCFPCMTNALPTYPAGPLRTYRLPLAFRTPRQIAVTRYGLAARDYRRWHALWDRLQMLERR